MSSEGTQNNPYMFRTFTREKNKIELQDTMMDVAMKMSDGNPGAIDCIMRVMQEPESTYFAGTPGFMLLLNCDSMGLYGSDLYMIWNDCCNRDIKKFELVMRNFQMGKLTEDQIFAQVASGRGKPFENLVSLEDLFGKEPYSASTK